MSISISEHFSYAKLFKFTLPSILMMIFTSLYGVADGLFVSNFAGKTPFAAVNFIMPFLMILGAVGFMFGTGGGALISKTVGEGDGERAKRLFSLFVYVTVVCGVILGGLGIAFIRPVARLLGAEGEMLEGCVTYGRIILIALPAYMLQYEFQSLFAVAEKPRLGLAITVAAGVANIALDALFVVAFNWGLVGAAAATAVSQAVGGIAPIIYFLLPNKSKLRLGATKWDFKALLRACANGSSELLSNISMSLVAMLYNMQLMNYAGEDGVAAYGVLMYVNMIFLAAYIGYSVGSAPIAGFNFGAKRESELKGLLKKSFIIISVLAAAMLALAEGLAAPLAKLFVGYDQALCDLTVRAFRFFSFSFLFAGFAIYGSSFFTALNNGFISALISFMRTLVFQIAAVLILPLFLGIDGIWISIIVAEFMAAAVTALLLILNSKKYGYF
ncbi:MAG: MATE family efflux transporter [Candidatus Coproplasma sp.]